MDCRFISERRSRGEESRLEKRIEGPESSTWGESEDGGGFTGGEGDLGAEEDGEFRVGGRGEDEVVVLGGMEVGLGEGVGVSRREA